MALPFAGLADSSALLGMGSLSGVGGSEKPGPAQLLSTCSCSALITAVEAAGLGGEAPAGHQCRQLQHLACAHGLKTDLGVPQTPRKAWACQTLPAKREHTSCVQLRWVRWDAQLALGRLAVCQWLLLVGPVEQGRFEGARLAPAG